MASSALESISADDLVVLDRGNDTIVKIHLFGATVVSWQNSGEEILFLSSKVVLDNKKAIRGGIPVVFPNFGPWDLGPAHGFARISRWVLTQTPEKDAAGDVCAVLTLNDSEFTRQMWNYKFQLNYKITLKETELVMEFSVTNKGEEPFSFTCLLHTYLRVPDITDVKISNLKGLTFTDKVAGGANFTEDRDSVTIAENVDRVYKQTPGEHVVSLSPEKSVLLIKNNFPDTVVWNPWQEKAAAMADLGDDDYPSMVCVEAGYVDQAKTLPANEVFTASQTLKCNL